MSKSETKPAFLFTVCQAGAEAALKREIARSCPRYHFAFSRPGFVTFKVLDCELSPDFELRSIFARAYGISCGKGKAAAVAEFIRAQRQTGLSTCIHLWERDQYLPGDEPLGFVAGEMARTTRVAIEEVLGEKILNREARPGERVIDIVAVESLEKGQIWYGCHDATPAHSPWAGGRPPVTLPAGAPSRAWLKIEEAIRWGGLDPRPGDFALEIGSAPGGASYALLERGLYVIGVDPADMDARVAAYPRFHHLKRRVEALNPSHLTDLLPPGAGFRWLLLDINNAPELALGAIERLAVAFKPSLQGMVLTLKMNEWKLADQIPAYLEKIRGWGLSRVRAVQLPSHRQEICVIAQPAVVKG